MKNLVVLGASIESCEGLKVAHDMGDLRLIVVDKNPEAPGLAYADLKIFESTYEPETIIKALYEHNIQPDAVIAMCSDVPRSVARIAAEFSLPGLNPETALLVSDKLLMKQALQQAGIPIPHFFEVHNPIEAHELAEQIGYPIILKPLDNCGARGVQYVERQSNLEKSFFTSLEYSPSGRLMIEQFLAGPQVSTETLVDQGVCYTLGFADRNYEWLQETKPFVIENGGQSPSSLSGPEQKAIADLAEKAALALGISSGIAKGDMVLTDEGPKVIEIAGRLSGGYLSTVQIPLNTGVNFIQKAIKLALGERLLPENVSAKKNTGVAIRYLKVSRGKIKSIRGVNAARNSAGVQLLNMLIQEGETLNGMKTHTERGGLVICSGDSEKQAVERAHQALALIEVDYDN